MNLPYGFRRVAHTARKDTTVWEAHVTLVTDQDIDNEVEVQRDLETLVRGLKFPLFGHMPHLGSVTFNWTPDDHDRENYGDITCVVTIGYRSFIAPVLAEELQERLAALTER
jgi:hypothetical protein